MCNPRKGVREWAEVGTCKIQYNQYYQLHSWCQLQLIAQSHRTEEKDKNLYSASYLVKAMFFPVAMYGCDYKESWVLKNWCFWTMVLEKTLESLLDCKEIQPVHPKGNQVWIFIGRTDAEAETPILWPPDAKNWLIGKDPDAGKDWRQKEKGAAEDEMVGWHHLLNGHDFEQALGVGDGQGSLCAAVHGVAKSRTWLSDWIELIVK